MELHNKTVIPGAQVGFEGTYGHVLVIKLLLHGLEVVLVIFEEGQQDFALCRTVLCLVQNVDFRHQKVIRLLRMTGRTCIQYNIGCCPLYQKRSQG